MIKPCKNCPTRKMYAKMFDFHFWGEDCPYECEEYNKWREIETANMTGAKVETVSESGD